MFETKKGKCSPKPRSRIIKRTELVIAAQDAFIKELKPQLNHRDWSPGVREETENETWQPSSSNTGGRIQLNRVFSFLAVDVHCLDESSF